MKKVNEKLFNKFLKPQLVDTAVIKQWKQFKKCFPVSFITTETINGEVKLKNHFMLKDTALSTVND